MSKETNPAKGGNHKKSCPTCSCCRHPVCLGIRVVVLAAILVGLWLLYKQNIERKQEIQALMQEIGRVQHGSTKVSLQEIDLLLSLASYDSQLFGSKARLFNHLSDISRITERMPTSFSAPLRVAIAQDRQRLTDYTPTDVKGTVEKIDAWIALVDPLSGSLKETVPASATPLNKNEAEQTSNDNAKATVSSGSNTTTAANTGSSTGDNTTVNATDTTEKTEKTSTWPEKLQQGWEQLKGIVKINRGESDENVFVVTTQKWVITEKLKMQLESMKIAVLSHDNTLFQRTRLQALNWLDTYYTLNSDDSRQLRDGLMSASNWDVSLRPFRFDNVKSAMNTLQQQQDKSVVPAA